MEWMRLDLGKKCLVVVVVLCRTIHLFTTTTIGSGMDKNVHAEVNLSKPLYSLPVSRRRERNNIVEDFSRYFHVIMSISYVGRQCYSISCLVWLNAHMMAKLQHTQQDLLHQHVSEHWWQQTSIDCSFDLCPLREVLLWYMQQHTFFDCYSCYNIM